MLSYNKALKTILAEAGTIGSEKVDIVTALGRVLAEDIRAKEDIPGFDRSAMDGYAVRACDLKKASQARPVCLTVLADLPAGYQTRKRLRPKTAIRIMTGAPLPSGADSVVMVEYTRKVPAGKKNTKALDSVNILRPPKLGANISFAGEDVKKNEVVINKGALLGPSEIGMLASLGRAHIRVSRRPLIAVIPTGDEVQEIKSRLNKGQVRDSNSFALSALAVSCGAQASRSGIARDSKPVLLRKIKQALKADIVVLSGGVSVGDYDLVKDALIASGVKMLFWKIRMKPGKPVFFGRKGKTLVFGLPGYPVSAMVTFSLFVCPVIETMLGLFGPSPSFKAVLEKEIAKPMKRRNFMRAKLSVNRGRVFVTPGIKQKSGMLTSMLLADCLIEIPEGTKTLKPGKLVKVIPLKNSLM